MNLYYVTRHLFCPLLRLTGLFKEAAAGKGRFDGKNGFGAAVDLTRFLYNDFTKCISILGVGKENHMCWEELRRPCKELNNAVPTEPVLFLKTPSAYLTEGSPILIPKYSNSVHHEIELGVVIGKGGTAIPQSSAMQHVAGYTLCLDMTARDVQDDCKSKGLRWTLAKAFNTSCPVIEFIPKERIPDPGNVKIWLKVDDQMRQNGCTSQMIFSIPFLISYISEIITLEEGDLILTGTPKGVMLSA